MRLLEVINIVVPMAGGGKRFKDAGYTQPKPMISIAGRPMIDWAIECVSGLKVPHKFIFLALASDLKAGLGTLLSARGEIVVLNEISAGAVNTTLHSKYLIDNSDPLVIANCDQYLEWNFNEFINSTQEFDGSVVVFESTNPHHSYIEASNDLIIRVKEKEVISDLACGGVYFYRRGSDYVQGAQKLIESNERTNGEFYITPVFNKLIEINKKITYFKVSSSDKHMLGTPEEVKEFLKTTERIKH